MKKRAGILICVLISILFPVLFIAVMYAILSGVSDKVDFLKNHPQKQRMIWVTMVVLSIGISMRVF